MARKGKEIALQQEIETQEEWEDMLSKEGLCGMWFSLVNLKILNFDTVLIGQYCITRCILIG